MYAETEGGIHTAVNHTKLETIHECLIYIY